MSTVGGPIDEIYISVVLLEGQTTEGHLMISADEAGRLLATLPTDSYIREFCWWASQCTDAPLAYHVASALGLLGTLASPAAGLRMGQPIYAPQWVMLVGDSGSTRKSSAIHCVTRLLHAACPEKIGSTPGSVQGLYQAMSETSPQIMIPYSEFGTFLSDSKSGGVLAPLREAFTSLWDGVSIQYRTVKSKRDITEPRLSLLVGTTTSFLEAHTTHVDWEGGFLSRWMVIHAEREFVYVFPPGHATVEKHLVNRTAAYRACQLAAAGGFTADAWDFYSKWFHRVAEGARRDSTAWSSGLANRAPTVALKAAIGHAFDLYPSLCCTPGWEIPLDSVEFGTVVAEWHLRSANSVLDSLATSKAGREQRTVIQAIGASPRTLGSILARCNPTMDKRDVVRVLDTLMESGRLYAHSLPEGRAYGPDAPAVQEGTIVHFRQQA